MKIRLDKTWIMIVTQKKTGIVDYRIVAFDVNAMTSPVDGLCEGDQTFFAYYEGFGSNSEHVLVQDNKPTDGLNKTPVGIDTLENNCYGKYDVYEKTCEVPRCRYEPTADCTTFFEHATQEGDMYR
eukprot:UN00942